MATTIGNLAVILSANTSKFSTGMQRAGKTLRRFGAGVAKQTARVAKMAAALTAVAAGATAVLVKRQMEAIDTTAKLADVLGFTTEQLTGLQHAASIAGVSQQELSTGLRRLQKNISDASKGLTTSIRAFEDLGLSYAALESMSPDQQFKAIANAMGNLESQAQRVRVAQDLFGRSGVNLLKILEGGSEGIAAMQREAEKLGITFNRIDAAKIEIANDSITRLKASFTGLINQLAIKFAPLIAALAEKLTAFVADGVNGTQTLNVAFAAIADTVAVVADTVELLKAGFLALRAGATASLRQVLITWSAFKDAFGRDVTEINQRIGEMTANLMNMQDAFLEAQNNYRTGEAGKRVRKWFADLEADMTKRATAIAESVKPAFAGVGDTIAAELGGVLEDDGKIKLEVEPPDSPAARDVSFRSLNASVARGQSTTLEKSQKEEVAVSKRILAALQSLRRDGATQSQQIQVVTF